MKKYNQNKKFQFIMKYLNNFLIKKMKLNSKMKLFNLDKLKSNKISVS